MGIQQEASKLFPQVEWLGQSDIHVSIARGGEINIHPKNWKEAMALLAQKNVGHSILRTLNKHFDGLIWLVSPEEFVNLFLVDCYRHLNGLPDSESERKLVNPFTGNKFHRIAIRDNLVFGIRFWCDPLGERIVLGFRFRLELQNEEEDETRRRAREVAAEANDQIEEVLDSFMEIKEPSSEELANIDEVLTILES